MKSLCENKYLGLKKFPYLQTDEDSKEQNVECNKLLSCRLTQAAYAIKSKDIQKLILDLYPIKKKLRYLGDW